MDQTRIGDRELVFGLLDAAAVLERHLDTVLSNIKGISFSEYRLLAALEREHDSTATRVGLAGAVGLTPSGVTRALRPLEKLGFVETIRDARDARRSLATLAEGGVELVSDAHGVVNDTIAQFSALDSVNDGDRALVAQLVTQLARG